MMFYSRISMFFFVWSAAFAQSASIQGRILSVDGTPIGEATAHFMRIPLLSPKWQGPARLAPGETVFSSSFVSTSDGGYRVQGAPAGTYLICVDVPDRPFLDPCKWGVPPSTQIGDGEIRTVDVTVKKGVFLNVRVNDPKGLLQPSERHPLEFPQVIIGIKFGGGAFWAAKRVGVDSSGQDYRIAVPIDVPVRAWIFSRYVSLSDAQGNPILSGGSEIPFQAVGGVQKQIVVNVTGAAIQE